MRKANRVTKTERIHSTNIDQKGALNIET
jgi:hypothetical protein